jgi:hypothetical protein
MGANRNKHQRTAPFPIFFEQEHPDPASALNSGNIMADDEPNLAKDVPVNMANVVVKFKSPDCVKVPNKC